MIRDLTISISADGVLTIKKGYEANAEGLDCAKVFDRSFKEGTSEKILASGSDKALRRLSS